MRVREITVTYGGKLNLGDYNSAHIELSATALVDDEELLETASRVLFDQVKTEVRRHVVELLKKRNTRIDDVFAGLPIDVRAEMK